MIREKVTLVTGAAGFVGTNLADRLLRDGEPVDALLCARANVDGVAGRAFNIGGGPRNAVSLLDVTALIEELTGSEPELSFGPWRQGDQHWYVSDPAAFGAATGWKPRVAPREGISALYEWLAAERADAVAEAA